VGTVDTLGPSDAQQRRLLAAHLQTVSAPELYATLNGTLGKIYLVDVARGQRLNGTVFLEACRAQGEQCALGALQAEADAATEVHLQVYLAPDAASLRNASLFDTGDLVALEAAGAGHIFNYTYAYDIFLRVTATATLMPSQTLDELALELRERIVDVIEAAADVAQIKTTAVIRNQFPPRPPPSPPPPPPSSPPSPPSWPPSPPTPPAPPSPPPPPPPLSLPGGASVRQDPHLAFAHSGCADFRGCDSCLFNFLSARDVSINARTSNSMFRLGASLVHGTFVTEVHVAALDRPTRTWLNVSYWASEVGPGNWGWSVVNGTCGWVRFTLRPNRQTTCRGSTVRTNYSSAVIRLPEWAVEVFARPVYDRIDGPLHRLDLSLGPLRDDADLPAWPHGLVGQSFDGDGRARHGRLDDYSAAEVVTTAMAEGAIEGTAADHRVHEPYATHFRFSRFNATADTWHRRPGAGPLLEAPPWRPRADVREVDRRTGSEQTRSQSSG